MNVWLGFDRLAAHFGPGTLAVTLVQGLRERGHAVTVFVDEPVAPDNQYAAAFRAAGAELSTPGPLVAAAARWVRSEALLLAALLPVRLPLALGDALLHRRTPARAWQAVRGRLNRALPQRALARPLRRATMRRMSRRHAARPATLLHMITGVGAGFAWAARHGVPIVYNENIVPGPGFGVAWWDDVIRHAADVRLTVSVCAAAEPAIRDFLGYRGPLLVIPNTIADPLADETHAPPPSADDRRSANHAPRAARDAPAAVPVIGCAARLDAVKGIDLLLRAFARLRQPAELRLAGDGPERERLRALAAELGVAARVRFLGHCGAAGMAAFWHGVDVFALASRWEGLPLVILEAMAYGKPVVATAVDGVPEAVRDRDTGSLVPVGEVEPLAAALDALLADPAARAAMGTASRARFLREFCAGVTMDRWLAAYARVAGPA